MRVNVGDYTYTCQRLIRGGFGDMVASSVIQRIFHVWCNQGVEPTSRRIT